MAVVSIVSVFVAFAMFKAFGVSFLWGVIAGVAVCQVACKLAYGHWIEP